MHPILFYQKSLVPRSHPTELHIDSVPTQDGVFRRWMHSAYRSWLRRRMVGIFEAMDDHLLGDIGIRRDGIERFVDSLTDRELRMVPVARPSVSVRHQEAAMQLAA